MLTWINNWNKLVVDNMEIDNCGNLYVSFDTESADINSFDSGCSSYYDGTLDGVTDQFLTKFSTAGILRCATYIGGNESNPIYERRSPIAIDANNAIYMGGEWTYYTSGTGLPLMNPGGNAKYDDTPNGLDDSFIMKFIPVKPAYVTSQVNPICLCTGSVSVTVGIPCSTPPFNYIWSNGTSTLNTTNLSSGINNLCPGTYWVEITDADCIIDTVYYTLVFTGDTLTLSNNQVSPSCNTFCNGTDSVIAIGGTGPYTYLWSNNQFAQTASALCAGIYTVTVTDSNGCIATTSITVNEPAPLIISVSSTSLTCNGNSNGTATAGASGGTNPYNYSWSNGTNQQTINSLQIGNYTVTVKDNNGCTDLTTVNITGNFNPTANAEANVIITIGQSTILSATGGGNYLWTPSKDLSCDTCANPVASPTITTTYCVEVTDTHGCTDSACVTVTVELPCGKIYVPTAFSPDRDGENELECMYGYCIKTLDFVIYSRWGEIVFETTDPSKCWDGIFKGVEMDEAVFVYYINAVFVSGEVISQKGNISLIK